MGTLIDFFKEQEPGLAERLNNTSSATDAVKVLRSVIKDASSLEKAYLRGLTPQQGRLTCALLNAMDEGLRTVAASTAAVSTEKPPAEDTSRSMFQGAMSGLVSGIAFGATGGGPIGLALAAASGAAIGSVFKKVRGHRRDQPDASGRLEQTDASALLQWMEDSFQAIDNAVTELEPTPSPEPNLEAFPDILEFFQSLLGDTHNETETIPEYIKKRIADVPRLLHRHGLVVEFVPPETGANLIEELHERFDILPDPDGKSSNYTTAYPALTSGDRVVLRGELIGPAKVQ